MPKNYIVEDSKPENHQALDIKPNNLMPFDFKPSNANIDTQTAPGVYVIRTLGVGMWMGSPFLTYPNNVDVFAFK